MDILITGKPFLRAKNHFAKLKNELLHAKISPEGPERGAEGPREEKNGFGKQSRRPENGLLKKDVPWQMLLPMAVTAGAIIFTGLFNAYIVDDVLKYTVSEVLLR